MHRVPFGVRRLDSTLGGGAPPGSVVLLSGEPGAGAREFVYTSALMNGLAHADEELFDLYYGTLAEASELPGGVHYVSFTDHPEQVRGEMRLGMDDDLVEAGLDAVTFHDLSAEYFRLSPVPRDWYTERTTAITDLGTQDRTSVAEALGDRLNEHAPGNLVVIDSLTDLAGALGDEYGWADISMLVRGLARAAYDWGGLVLVHLNREALTAQQHGQLVDATDGILLFQWERGGSTLARTMVVQQFRGVLSAIEEESIVQFETQITDSGFDISEVRKIR
ncbi:RAD55 family ATPase [Halomarina litorea]|uniref:RAD55 family ATPase n=1 Tax=Halomarina litorea TaxID=2961595 RepID=UPI0020C417F0|nr:HTR-like protein [Halomarina sp. BCD28]